MIERLIYPSFFMKKIFHLLALAPLFFSCQDSNSETQDAEQFKIEYGDPGTAYDDVQLKTLEDRVAYSVGYNSSEDAKEFLNSKKYHKFFDRVKMRDGFFYGIENADSVQAQEYNGLLMLYFQNPGEFDTANIKPAEASYYMGYLRGYELKRSLEIKNIAQELSKSILKKGYKDGLWDAQPLVPLSDQNTIITEFFSGITKREGHKFLLENKKKPGVIETASGLQYKVIKPGKGPKPGPNSKVFVYYTLRDISDRVLETNANQPEPISFYLNQVIPGWTEGLQLMQAGGQYRLYVPYELGYGANGAPPKIQPYSTLVFEIELVRFE
jgi:FKBP-type peptidyl-prolyl cis-trans isomerase